MSSFKSYEEPVMNIIDLHSACRMSNLEGIKQAYKQEPDKLNSRDAGVISI